MQKHEDKNTYFVESGWYPVERFYDAV